MPVAEFSLAQTKTQRLTLLAAWSASFAAFSGLWQYGFSMGSVNAVYQPVNKAIKQNYKDRYNKELTPELTNAIWVIISVGFPVGGMIGSLLVGTISRKFGRLKGLCLGHAFTIMLSILLGVSGVIKSPEAIILGRIGIGISAAAFGTGIAVMYVSEVSPRHLRGFFGGLVSTGISLGLLMSNICGIPQALGNENLWPLLLALSGFPSVVFLSFSGTMSESPRKLFISDNNKVAATKVLRRLRGVYDVSQELEEMEKEANEASSSQQLTVLQLIQSSKLRRATISAIICTASQQLTGINGVAFNMNNIYLEAGISSSSVHYFSIGVAAALFTLALIMSRLSEKFGRKKLLITGYGIMGCSLFLLTVAIETREKSVVMAYVAVVASFGFFIGFGTGPGPMTLTLVPECFDQSVRSAAVTLAVFVLWISFGIMVVAMPYMLDAIGGYAFMPSGICAVLAVLYIRFFIPETKNKTFLEIKKAFERKKTEEADTT